MDRAVVHDGAEHFLVRPPQRVQQVEQRGQQQQRIELVRQCFWSSRHSQYRDDAGGSLFREMSTCRLTVKQEAIRAILTAGGSLVRCRNPMTQAVIVVM